MIDTSSINLKSSWAWELIVKKVFFLYVLLVIVTWFGMVCVSDANGSSSNVNDDIPPVRAVFLGGWLSIEGWLRPSLFDAIPNKDLLDGTRVQLKSVTLGKYLSAQSGGGTILVATSTPDSGSTFRLWRMNATSFNFRVSNGEFVGIEGNGVGIGVGVVALADHAPGVSETFQIQRNPDDLNRVRIKAPNGFFLQVKKTGEEERVTADYQGTINDGWGDDNPSVFLLTITNPVLRGEYQLTNGLGPDLAPLVMKNHWNTFIVEEDFRFMKNNGLNAVRIPVGWWIAHDLSPPKPYVGGSLQALDNAFSWAEKYGIKMIINLQAAPGSQNGWEHSSSRDGSIEWGKTDANIQQTVDVISFLTSRYAKRPNLFAVELLNEPLAPGVSLDVLNKYYRAGYDAVRKHSSTAYVILSNRLSSNQPRELFPLANGFTKSVIDVHYYNLFTSEFDSFTVQQHLDYVYINRTAQLNDLITPDGPLVFVGEWTAALPVTIDKNVTKEEVVKFGQAQLEVFGQATFGWAYATLKSTEERDKYWNMEWMIKNGYIQL